MPVHERGDHPSRTARRGVPKFFDRGEATKAKRPWWKEACRQDRGFNEQEFSYFKSMIACYCLSDNLRLLLIQSAPQLSMRIARPFDLSLSIGFTRHLQLPVSLEDLATGQPFAVVGCLLSLLSGQGLRILGLEMELETCTRKEITLSSEKKSSNDLDACRKVDFSMCILVAYQWQRNLEYLKETFKRRRFVALAQPGMRTYLPLIDLRQKIVGMRDNLPIAQMESDAYDKYMGGPDGLERLSLPPSTNLSKTLARISEEIEKLDKELNDEIHLIIGAVTVQDSDANKTQTERAALLTLLAAVYLPLTLVTGIFGMNIKEISDGNPTWRHCGEVLAVTAACTIVFVLAYRQWKIWRRVQQEKERSEFAFDKEV